MHALFPISTRPTLRKKTVFLRGARLTGLLLAFAGASVTRANPPAQSYQQYRQSPPSPQNPPSSATVVSGAATFQSGTNSTTVTTTSNSTILEYKTFNIPTGYTMNFVQPSSTSRVLNRVTGEDPAQIFGSLTSNGIVYLVDPAGIYFGPHSFIDVGALYAASGSLDNRDFLNASDHFTNLKGSVVNDGTLQGGAIALIGQSVSNTGTIRAPAGLVALVSGDDVYLGQRTGSIFVQTNKTSPLSAVGVTNSGAIDAPGGQVILAAGDLYSIAIQQNGAVTGRDVTLQGQGSGQVWQNGRIDASNTAAGSQGGTVQITGQNVGVGDGASIDASGAAGGGTVLVGGDFHGTNAAVRDADATYVAPTATIRADALSAGDGGKIVLWSNQSTRFLGQLSARGAGDGTGGAGEVSSHEILDFRGAVDFSAASGKSGTLLLDPADLNIDSVSDTNVTSSSPFTPTADGTHLKWSTILSALASTDVTLSTDHTVTGAGNGDIIFSAASGNFTSAHALTFDSSDTNGAITINSGATITNQGSGNINFISGSGNISVGANISTLGTISFNHSGTLSTSSATINAGTLSLHGSGGVGTSVTPLSLNVGQITLSNSATDTYLSNAGGVSINGSTSGNLSLTATGPMSNPSGQTLSVTGTTDFDAVGHDITLTENNVFTGTVTLSNASNINIKVNPSGAMTLADLSTGNFQASAGTLNLGSVTNTGTFQATGTTLNLGLVTSTGTFQASGTTINLGGDISVTDNSLTLTGNVVLPASVTRTLSTVSSTGGAIQITGSSTGAGGGADTLTLNSGTGSITLGTLGDGTATGLTAVNANSTGTLTLSGISLNGTFNAGGSGASLTFNGTANTGSASLTGSTIAFNQNYTSTGSLGTSSGSGVTIASNVTVSGSSAATLSGNLVLQNGATLSSSGNVGVAGNVTVGADGGTANITATGAITLNSNASTFVLGTLPATPRETLNLTGNSASFNPGRGASNLVDVIVDAATISGSHTFDGTVKFKRNTTFSGIITLDSANLISVGSAGSQNLTFNNSIVLETGDSTINSASGSLTVNNIGTSVAGATNGITLISNLPTVTGAITTAGVVQFAPSSSSSSIGIGDTSSGTLQITSSLLGHITDGTQKIVIGSTNPAASNTVSISQSGNLSFRDPVVIQAGSNGSISFDDRTQLVGTNEAGITLSGKTVTLNNNQSVGLPIIQTSTGDIVLSGAVQVEDSVSLSSSSGSIILSSGGTIDHGATLSSDLVLSTGGNVELNGAVGSSGPLDTLSATGALVQLENVTTGTSQTYGGPLQLLANTTLKSPAFTFTAGTPTIDGNTFDLTLDNAAGGAVGLDGSELSNINNFTATGATQMKNAFVTTGSQTYTGAVTLSGAAQFSGSTLTFTGGLNANGDSAELTHSSATTFNGANFTNLAAFKIDGAGTTTLSGTFSSSGSQEYDTAILLGGATTLTPSSGNVKFSSSVDGAQSLTINSAGTFASDIGGTTPLTSFDITGGMTLSGNTTIKAVNTISLNGVTGVGNDLTLSLSAPSSTISVGSGFSGVKNLAVTASETDLSGSINTTGSQTYTSNVVLTGATSLNTSSTIGFTGTVDGATSLTINTAGQVTVGGNLGSNSMLTTFSHTGGGETVFEGHFVKTSSDQTYSGLVSADPSSGTLTFNGNNGTFSGGLSGASGIPVSLNYADLTYQTAATTIESLSVNASLMQINGTLGITTTGAQSYTSAVQISNGGTFSGSSITFGGLTTLSAGTTTLDAATSTFSQRVIGPGALSATGDVHFTGWVGYNTVSTPLASLNVTGKTNVGVDTGLGRVFTTGTETFGDAVTLQGATELKASGATFNGTVEGPGSIDASTMNVPVTFNGDVGDTTQLSSLSLAATTINGSVVKTTGSQSYGALTLGDDVSITANALTTADIEGAHNLDLNVSGATTIQSVGATNPVGSGTGASLTLDSAGATTFNGVVNLASAISQTPTTSTVSFNGNVTLGAGTSTLKGNVVLNDATFVSGGPLTFGSSSANTLTVSRVAGTTVDTHTANVAVTVKSSTILNGPLTLTSGSGSLTFGAADGGQSLTLTSSGGVIVSSLLGGTTPLQNLTVNGPATLAGGITTTGSQTYNGVLTVGADSTLKTTTPVTSSISLDGLVDGAHGLTLTSPTVNINAAIGSTTPLMNFTVSGGTLNIAANIHTAGGTDVQHYNSAVLLTGTHTLTGSNVIFNDLVDGSGSLNGVGNFTFANKVGSLTPLGSLTINGAAALNGQQVTTSGTQDYEGAVSFSQDLTLHGSTVTVASGLDSAHALIVQGNADFSSAIGQTTPLASLSVSGNTSLGGNVKTTGTQTYSQQITLSGNTVLTGSTIDIAGAVDGALALSIVGNGTFGGTVGANTPLNSLSVSGTTTLSASNISTAGTQTYSGQVDLAGNTSLTGSLVTIGGTLDGALDLTIHGAADFGNSIGQTTPLNSLTVTGSTQFGGAAVKTTGIQSYQSATLTHDLTLGGSTITFGGAVDGNFALDLEGAGVFDQDVGQTTPLASLSVSGATQLSSASVKTSGTQLFSGAVTLTQDVTLSGTTLTFGSTVDGAHALVLDGAATLNGDVGANSPLQSLTANGATLLDLTSISTSADQTYNGALTLGQGTTLNATAVTFGSTVDGGVNLDVNGNVSIEAAIGGTTLLQTLHVTGTTTLNSPSVTTLRTQTYSGAVSLTHDSALGGSLVTFGGSVDGNHALTITGDADFEGAVGATTMLTSVGVSGATQLDGGLVKTSGVQTYSGATTLGQDTALDGWQITFAATLDGPGGLTGVGQFAFANDVGANTPLAFVTLTGPIQIDATNVMTSGAQAYHGAVTFSQNLNLSGSTVTFDQTVDSAQALTIHGDASFTGAVGHSTPLAALSVSGNTALLGGSVTTVGAQNYSQQMSLGGDMTLTGASVTIGGSADGAHALTIAGDGNFDGTVGSTTPLTSISVSGLTTLNAPNITTTGIQIYSGQVNLAGNTTLTGSRVTIGGTVDGALDLTIDGMATLNGAIGQTTPLDVFTVTGAAQLNGTAITTSGAQDYQSTVQLGTDLTLTGASLHFGGAVDGAFSLTTFGATTFDQSVGHNTALAALSVNGSTTLNGPAVTTTGAQTYAGSTTIGQDTNLTGTDVSFAGTLDGAHVLAVNGDASFAGSVGGATPLTSLNVTGETLLNGANVTTTSTQHYTGAVTLGAASTLTGSGVTFDATVDGGFDLAVAGNATFNGAVGDSTPLGSLSVSGIATLNTARITTSGNQSYAGALQLTRDSNLTGALVDFGGSIDGAHDLNIAGDARFHAAIGSVTPLASLEVSGHSDLDGGTIKTVGIQTYSGPSTLGGDTTLTGSRMVFGSTLDGSHALTINGGVSFGGAVGGSVPLYSFTINGPITLTAGVLNTTGPQTYSGAVTLGRDNSLGASLVKFTGTVDGPYALTISNDAEFGGAIGASQPLTDLTVNGLVSFADAHVTTTGVQTYGGAFTLTGDAELTGSRIRFLNTVDGNHSLIVNGPSTFGADLGSTSPLAALSLNGDVDFGGARLLTTGAQVFGGNFLFEKDAELSGSALTFGGTLDGAHALTLNGTTTFNGPIGAGTALSSLAVNGPTSINGSSITTTGAQLFTGPTTLGTDVSVTATSAKFGSQLDGAHALVVQGDAEFDGAVGSAAPLSSIAVSGSSIWTGGVIDTTGAQTYSGAIALGADTTVAGSTVAFGSTVDGPFAMTVTESGGANFDASVGATTALKSLTVTGPVTIGAETVTTTGEQQWGGAVQLKHDATLTGTTVTFNSTVDGANKLAIKGDAVFGGAVGVQTALAALSVSGASHINAPSIATTGDQSYSGAVTLGSDATISASTGDITFDGAIDAASKAGLTVNAAEGFAAFNAGVGQTSPLDHLSVSSHDMRLGATTTSGDQSYNSAAGAVIQLTGNMKTTDGNLSFSSERSAVPVVATIFHNTAGDLTIDVPKGNFTMGEFERFLVSGGKTSTDQGGNLTFNVGGKATLGDFAVSKIITVHADKIDFVGSYIQATDIFLVTANGSLMPESDLTFRGAPSGSTQNLVSLSTRNGTPFAATSPDFLLRLIDPSVFKDNRIDPEKFPVLTATNSLLFQEFNVFPVFTASSRTNLSEILGGAIPTATVEVQPASQISSAVRDQLVLLGIFARQLSPTENKARRANRTIYEQIIPTEAREPDAFTVADGRISERGAVDAVRQYQTLFTRRDDQGATISRIPELQQTLARAFMDFRAASPTAEPAEFAQYLQTARATPSVENVRVFFGDMAHLFRTIESLGLTPQEIAVSKTVLLRPLRVVGLPSSVLRGVIESMNPSLVSLKKSPQHSHT